MSCSKCNPKMFTRFTDITNNLKSLGKTYTNEEMVRKILRCLPKNKWVPRVTAIEEVQNLKKLSLNDLLRKLLTHEIHLKEDEEEKESQPKKGVSLNSTSEKHYCSEDESNEEDEDSMAMTRRGLKKIFKSKKFNPKKFYKKGSFSKKNDKTSNGNKLSNNKNKSNLSRCFGYSLPGHVMESVPLYKRGLKNANKKQRKSSRKP